MRRPEIPQWRRVATPFALAAVSFAVALILWIAVTDAENPQTVEDFRVPVEVQAVNVPEGLAITSIPPVRLRVSADADVFQRLTTADFIVQVDLNGITDFSLPQDVTVRVAGDLEDEVEIVAVSPLSVLVSVEPFASKQVPVRPSPVGELPQGYALSVPEATPGTVRISGARSLIDKVEFVTANVNLTGLRTSLTQQTVLVARDSRGLEIPRITIDPDRVELKVTVVQQEISVQLPIVAALQGTVADGYNIVGISLEPGQTTISGTLETTSSLTALSTEPIDVSGLRASFNRTVRLRVPTGVQAGRDSVRVNVTIEPAKGEMIINVAPQVSNVEGGLNASFQTASIAVRVSGDMPVLKTLTPGSVRATVNAAGYGEGVHILQPQIIILAQGVQVISIDPGQAVLVLRR